VSLVARSCFAHLAYVRRTHVEVTPVRVALSDGWLYFRADPALRHAIGHNAWVAMTLTERVDATQFSSVVARGACYGTDHTGSWQGDEAALTGIAKLRDRTPATMSNRRLIERTLVVFRLRLEDIRGTRSVVPCDAPA
jgi:hypothetical protein